VGLGTLPAPAGDRSEREPMADYEQTHVVPTEGLPAWAGPDGSVPPAANLDPGLDVMVVETRSEWAHIRCSNGWEAWVDSRRLIARPAPAASAAQPATPPPPSAAQSAPPPPPTTAQASTPPPPPGATQPTPTQPPPPSAAWGTPGAAPGAPGRAGGFRIGPPQIVALVGGLLFLVSAWFTWIHIELVSGARSASFPAYEIPAHFLLDSQSESGGLNLGIVIAFFGFACIATAIVSALQPRLGVLSLVAGVAAFLIVVLFLWQTKNFADELSPLLESGYFSVLRYGAYIALVSAIVTVVGGILSLVQKRS
jgi:hypothetical protein